MITGPYDFAPPSSLLRKLIATLLSSSDGFCVGEDLKGECPCLRLFLSFEKDAGFEKDKLRATDSTYNSVNRKQSPLVLLEHDEVEAIIAV